MYKVYQISFHLRVGLVVLEGGGDLLRIERGEVSFEVLLLLAHVPVQTLAKRVKPVLDLGKF